MLDILYIDKTATCACDLHFVPAIVPQGISISHPHNLEWPHVSIQFTNKGEKVVTN